MSRPTTSMSKSASKLVSSADLPKIDLENEVDPIFNTIINDGIDSMHPAYPALRLATHLITAGLPVFHAIFAQPSEIIRDTEAQDERKYRINFAEPWTRLTKSSQQKTRTYLFDLACSVSFKTHDEGRYACTKIDPTKTVAKLPGYGSTISIGKAFYDDIASAHFHGGGGEYFTSLLRLASVLIHELAHAACLAVAPSGNGFLGPEAKCDELGFEMEKRLFGGLPVVFGERVKDAFRPRCRGPALSDEYEKMSLFEWPNANIVQRYEEKKQPCQLKEGFDISEAFCVWEVEIQRVANLFQTSFWKEALASNGRNLDLLRFPKENGVLIVPVPLAGQNKEMTYEEAVNLYGSDDSVIPKGYALGPDGRVRLAHEVKTNHFKRKLREFVKGLSL